MAHTGVQLNSHGKETVKVSAGVDVRHRQGGAPGHDRMGL